jgi:hypothetical protein
VFAQAPLYRINRNKLVEPIAVRASLRIAPATAQACLRAAPLPTGRMAEMAKLTPSPRPQPVCSVLEQR